MVVGRSFQDILIALLGLIILFLAAGGFYLYRQQRKIAEHIADINNAHIELAQQIDIPAQVVEKVVSKSIMWRPIQEQVKDTVVQVFAQIAEFDILQPVSHAASIFFVW